MKKMIMVALLAVATMFTQDLFAQAPQKSEAEKAANKARSEQLMQTRLDMLKDELQLSDEQFAKFEPVYREYRKILGRVADHKAARAKKEELTNENALKVVSARLANTINTSSIKQRYLLIFVEVIEPLQIEKLYRIDDKVAKEARKVVQYRK